MNLDQYLSSDGALSVAQLRERMQSLGYEVKSDAQIRQWRHGYGGRRPDPKNCIGIERATNRVVTRKDLRPDDWQQIWPDWREGAAA
ncbi:transcriptional regulator [Ralstonia mannitolilytica]|uniref:transcriptional regulator n=1 Tax=Ralstonia mannitolilytica TaxID=105219 RepID=UPI0026EF974D|nr:YdaS family helix-turn-helix protein [Ralstonia mannitolilytica]